MERKRKRWGEREKRTRAGARSLSRKEDDIIHTLPDRARESTHQHYNPIYVAKLYNS